MLLSNTLQPNRKLRGPSIHPSGFMTRRLESKTPSLSCSKQKSELSSKMMQGSSTATGESESKAKPPLVKLGGPRKKVPSPREMVAHYESKGMQPEEASLKVIEDLQNVLLKVVTSTNKNKKNSTDDALVLRRLESKLDSKPGYPQTLAIGIVSGAVIQIFPHIAASVANIWNSINSSSPT